MSAAPDDDLLRRITLLRRLSPGARARVAEVARIKTYERGEMIFSEGDPADAFMGYCDGSGESV